MHMVQYRNKIKDDIRKKYYYPSFSILSNALTLRIDRSDIQRTSKGNSIGFAMMPLTCLRI
jgi:hypothetical protein